MFGSRVHRDRYPSMPRRSIGATANARDQTYARTNSFMSPASRFSSRYSLPFRNSSQVLPDLRAPLPAGGGQPRSRFAAAFSASSSTYNTVPRPCPSLIARLNAPENKFIFSRERQHDMKSVDQTVTKFKLRFSGLTSEH